MKKQDNSSEDQIKLYEMLVNQLQRYHSIIWQIPTALLVANIVAIDKFLLHPFFLFCLSLFNYILIYIFHRMIVQQKAIIKATQLAENKLRKQFPDYIPSFPKKKISSTVYFRCSLVVLNSILFAFSVYPFLVKVVCK